MQSHTRALIAASAFAFVTGKKVAGLYDHAEARDRLIAAESRRDQLQGFDGERQVKFSGRLPELYDEGDRVSIAMAITDGTVEGYDRGSATSYTARVADDFVQLYDHGAKAWFDYDVQNPDAAMSYYRGGAGAA
ncbi:hypothetical protein MTR62_04525 [Novosphingobium sp. 1949]|uniref:Uncharacterized protein n=1 Tax=Novosphingobium organovorum TaxID=2930092 RepID=A0ABT0BA96_9SPHN|nr:hypothetical protein [Novosphingobium organovorum]MCJ2181969.1 hypothetical protein [Novosphingobium organovorum]